MIKESVSATELSKLGQCQLRMLHDWGYTGVRRGVEIKATLEARQRGDQIHKVSEGVMEEAYRATRIEARPLASNTKIVVKLGLITLVILCAIAVIQLIY